jgi:(1->4)-alpha-D-glucan 1-alpha-D-glucosylmutase
MNDSPATDTPASRADLESRAERIWERVVALVEGMSLPDATYRLQFHRGFRFSDATKIVPYLSELGITHVYSSPYLKALAGSAHGYDVVDHSQLNPELGTEADFDDFVQALSAHGMQHLLDFVPNHMGVGGNDNAWWMDVLENGPSSPYAAFFDIDWMPLKPDLANKVLLPILGDQFGNVLESGQLSVRYGEGEFRIEYFDRRFPVAPCSMRLVMQHRIEELEQSLGTESPQLMEYQSILTAIRNLPPRTETDREKINEGRREKEVIKRRLNDLTASSAEVARFIEENVSIFNGKPGRPRSFDLLDELLQDQAYRLAYWRVATDEINYRRFFDVNELAAVCMESPQVFEQAHRFVFRLIDEGKLHGLRIDHADGLYDPTDYLRELERVRFRQLCRRAEAELDSAGTEGPLLQVASQEVESLLVERFDQRLRAAPAVPPLLPLYVIVEKILESGEDLPPHWPIHGTTGYEFLAGVNGLYVDPENATALERIYARFVHGVLDFPEQVYEGKKLIVRASMSSEVTLLGHQLDRLSERNRSSRDFTLSSLTFAIREIIASFPVYRTYITPHEGVLERDRRYVEAAVARAKRRNPAFSSSLFDFVRDLLLLKSPENASDEDRLAQQRFVGRFQQVTGPVTAKGVEDTAYYRYHRLISLNEVGGSPEIFGTSVESFHRQNLRRVWQKAHSLLATSTHDTKRSEDVRARINVLSEIPQEWKRCVGRWSRFNKRRKTEVDGKPAPGRDDEYLLYQTLVGTWPLEPPRGAALEAYLTRIQNYMIKAAREAKLYSSWIATNDAYEDALRNFIAAILRDGRTNTFRNDLETFTPPVGDAGLWNSLSQTLLKLGSPGAPDFYQGTELWDDSLVDPDNRRPVDFDARMQVLSRLRSSAPPGGDRTAFARELVKTARDGRIKLFVIAEALALRRNFPALLSVGAYLPLEARGTCAGHLCAFARRHESAAALVVAPRLVAGLAKSLGDAPTGREVWSDTEITLPAELADHRWRNVFTGELLARTPNGTLLVADVLGVFPIALLTAEPMARSP